MLDLLRGLKSLVKLSHVQIDSSIFRLHYTITVMACLAFSLLVTARQYVGNPIDCVHTKDIPEVRRQNSPTVCLNGSVSVSQKARNTVTYSYSIVGTVFLFQMYSEYYYNSYHTSEEHQQGQTYI